MQTRHIVIEGSIQGVGFRPFVYNLAKKLGIKGKVWNSHKGVEILLQANDKTIRQFLEELSSHPPSLSKIHRINSKTVSVKEQFSDFSIEHSSSTKALHSVIIPTDAAICPKCIEELQDPNKRRYRYPFISCVECGPRYTILKGLPYDRANSAMGAFTPCKECQEEYDDPNNRRFHAQNISCPKCGPDITLHDKEGILAKEEKALELLAKSLEAGRIAALKGTGGYHLVCDASNSEALKRLRSLKRRPHKPFAVMVSKLEDARAYIEPDAYNESLLSSKERPIVIGKKVKQEKLSELVAPYIDKLGVMLAYTPLHLMLLDLFDKPIVVTSANVSGAPICAAFEEIQAYQQLWDICLDHDLEILNRCDDSVVMGVENRTIMLRSARGYAPACFRLPSEMKQNTLFLGANQKNTIGFSFKDHLILSPYLGDLGTVESWEHIERSMRFFKELYHFTPDRYVCDKHPGYETNKWAKRQTTGKVTEVQHHAAHIASVMFEHNLNEEVLGVAFDGTGYGDCGAVNFYGVRRRAIDALPI
ncbi:MAG: carbamoyltransferase HypF [Sulfurimonas sp.]